MTTRGLTTYDASINGVDLVDEGLGCDCWDNDWDFCDGDDCWDWQDFCDDGDCYCDDCDCNVDEDAPPPDHWYDYDDEQLLNVVTSCVDAVNCISCTARCGIMETAKAIDDAAYILQERYVDGFIDD